MLLNKVASVKTWDVVTVCRCDSVRAGGGGGIAGREKESPD